MFPSCNMLKKKIENRKKIFVYFNLIECFNASKKPTWYAMAGERYLESEREKERKRERERKREKKGLNKMDRDLSALCLFEIVFFSEWVSKMSG